VNIYITDLAAPGCRQPGLYYYRHRGFWEGLIFRKIEKEEKEKKRKQKENQKEKAISEPSHTTYAEQEAELK
jgi:hypothetical protein